jgi:REP element-mobilizing transposase RayT
MRQNRHLVPNAVYHVTARINRGEFVFLDAAMRVLFLKYVKHLKTKYSFAIYNFCIMGNHIHFVIRPDKDSLSKIMQWLLGTYAKGWNKRHGVTGHLWGDRFFSRVVEGGREAFRRLFKYVSENPVEGGLVRRAWEWDSNGVCHYRKGELGILDIPPWVGDIYEILFG